jgi:hypothetical protein
VYLEIQEGDTIEITVSGIPAVWCGWLVSMELRSVSIDVGMQTITPSGGFTIAGGKHSGVVNKVLSKSDKWEKIKTQVPNSVLWYGRREFVPRPIMRAFYGISNTSKIVTDIVRAATVSGQDLPVTNESMQGDPAPGNPKFLMIYDEKNNITSYGEGSTIPAAKLANIAQFNLIVPATLVGPAYSNDLEKCPTGPLVFTETGAGLMGAHSCFKPDGSFNPSMYCMQQLWSAAGGTPKGKQYPKDEASAAALVVKGSLDDTVAALNNGVNIALYGVDSNGAPQDFEAVKAASLNYLGVTLTSPCDGPTAATGPHSKECLDYLWRTSGTSSYDAKTVDPKSLPYAYCGAKGEMAPLVSGIYPYGSVANIRADYKAIFNRAQDSSIFDQQAAAMKACYGANVQPTPKETDKCPLRPEVFQPAIGYTSTHANAAAVCSKYGARVATLAELENAQRMGADWCSSGWVSDHDQPKYPITTSIMQGCGNGSPGIKEWNPGNVASVNCFGKKPMKTSEIMPFNSSQWNAPNAFSKAEYLGCFGDTGNRAIPHQRADVSFTGDGQDGILACQNAAIASGDNVYGLQCSGSPSSNCNAAGRAQCFTGKDPDYAKYGVRQRCGPLGDAWTNQVYSLGEDVTPAFFKSNPGIMQNNKIGAITGTTKNYILSFDITPKEIIGDWSSILRFTYTDNNCCNIGDRSPAIWFTPGATALHCRIGDVNDGNWGIDTSPLPMNKKSNVKITCKDNNVTIVVQNIGTFSGRQPSSRVNPNGRTLNVYAGDRFYPAANATIANVSYTIL